MTTRRAFATNTAVLVGFTAISFLYFGLPLVRHPGRSMLGTGADPQIFVWSFAWWEHAIATGTNPLYSHAIYAPDGVNLAWMTAVSGLAVPFAPLTALFGPVASYNLAALLMPAAGAWTAYLLCRYLSGALWPSLVGGYLFGFSAYVVAEELGHLHMTSVFLLPLVALALVRFAHGDLAARGLVWRLGALLGWQLWISSEVFFTLTLAVVAGWLLAFAFERSLRLRLRSMIAPLAAGYALGAVLAAPFIWYAVGGFQSGSISWPNTSDAALANLVVPTQLLFFTTSGLTHVAAAFPGGLAERGAYIGIPALAIVTWFGVERRRSASGRFLTAAFVLATVASLGTALHLESRAIFRLPWNWLAKLPLFDNVLPQRLAVFTALTVAVTVALWTRAHPRLYALPILAIAFLVPAVWKKDYVDTPERWPFFTQGIYKICFSRGENVAIFPYGEDGYSTLWQAETGFYFRIAEGYVLPKPPEPFLDDPVVQQLTYTYTPATGAQIQAFARRNHVDRIVSIAFHNHPDGPTMRKFGPAQWVGGVIISPACGYPPLAG